MPQVTTEQEIDLSQISNKIKQIIGSFKKSIFKGIQFFILNWKTVAILIILGIVVGMVLDKTQKQYEHQIIVTPNFGSSDYLYAKIDLIEAKIKAGDTLFLKNVVGLKAPKIIKSITIEPVIDVYNFVIDKPEKFELIKLLSENGDINQVIKDNTTSKNYTFQAITLISTKQIKEDEVVKSVLKFLNTSNYYEKIQKEVYNNVRLKMKQNDTIINQIDAVLDNFSKSSSASKGGSLMYYNENTQLNDIIKTKETLIKEQGNLKIEMLTYDQIIKESSIVLNLESQTITNGKKKLLFPVFFVLLYIVIRYIRNFYNHQKILMEQ